MLVEYTVVFPVFLLVTLGTVDVAYMLSEWALANKATYVGARAAVVLNPVAPQITDPTLIYPSTATVGKYCFDFGTGTVDTTNCFGPTDVIVNCTSTTCTPSTYGNPPDTTASSTAFTLIVNKMQAVFPRLQTGNVTISYQLNGSGYVGRPSGPPMDVTVGIHNMTHQIYFLSGIMRFFGGSFLSTVPIPAAATTLTSEDMTTN
jgi:Flp pilus assembly protein TadG